MRQSFYGSIRASEYDIGTEQQPIYDFYLNRWKSLGAPNPVLEPMCGTGLNLIPFLQANADIDGLDSSLHMLAQCRAKCEAAGLKTNLYEQYIEKMALPRQYGFVFIPGGTFGHIYDKAIAQACLRNIWEHLLPGGWFVVDVRPPAYRSVFPIAGTGNFDINDMPDGSTIVENGIWADRDQGHVIRCWNKYEKYVDGQLVAWEIFDYNERFYDRDELTAMLQAAGFTAIAVTKMLEEDAEPEGQDGIAFSCQK